MEYLLELDREFFLALNGDIRRPMLDQVMMFLTETYAWIPLYLVLLFLLIRNDKKNTWIWLLAVAFTILLADQITSSVLKPFFERLRPSRDPSLMGQVYIVNGYRGGKFGFASSHAANTFGIATLMWMVLKRYRPWIGLLFLWTLLVGYTRIYLGVHFPGDILAGFAIGFACALVSYFMFLFVKNFFDRNSGLRSATH